MSGSTWKVQATPNPAGGGYGSLDEVSCAPAGPCTAVGSGGAFVERLVGGTWTLSGAPPAPPGYDALITGLSCASTTVCMFAGYDDQGTQRTLAESWNGSSWTPQTTPNSAGATDSQFDAVSCAGSPANGCMVVGNYLAANDSVMPLAETWNGSAWAIHSPTIPGASDVQLTGVSCHASNSCEAVGFGTDANGNAKPVAASWNGASWTAQSPSIPAGSTSTIPSGVSCTAANACTAVGSYLNPSGQVFAFAEHFTGTWSAALATPNPSNTYGYMALYGVSCTGATCETVGEADPNSGGRAAAGRAAERLDMEVPAASELVLPGSLRQRTEWRLVHGRQRLHRRRLDRIHVDDRVPVHRLVGGSGHPVVPAGPRAERLLSGVVRRRDRLHRGRDLRRRRLDQFGRMGEPDARAPAESLVLRRAERRRGRMHRRRGMHGGWQLRLRAVLLLGRDQTPRDGDPKAPRGASLTPSQAGVGTPGRARRLDPSLGGRRYRADPAPARGALLLALSRDRRSPSASPSRRSARSRTR